jgi:hypothetical protein
MKKNLGSADRIIRLLILVVAAVLYFTGTLTGTLGLVVLIVGVILGATAVINFCPIYKALGIKTNKSAA